MTRPGNVTSETAQNTAVSEINNGIAYLRRIKASNINKSAIKFLIYIICFGAHVYSQFLFRFGLGLE